MILKNKAAMPIEGDIWISPNKKWEVHFSCYSVAADSRAVPYPTGHIYCRNAERGRWTESRPDDIHRWWVTDDVTHVENRTTGKMSTNGIPKYILDYIRYHFCAKVRARRPSIGD